MGQRRQGDGAAPPGRWGSAMGNSFGPRTTVLDHMIYGRPLGPPQAPPVGLPQAPGTLSKAGGQRSRPSPQAPGPRLPGALAQGVPLLTCFFFLHIAATFRELQNVTRSAGASHRLFRRFERARSGVRTTETSGNPGVLWNCMFSLLAAPAAPQFYYIYFFHIPRLRRNILYFSWAGPGPAGPGRPGPRKRALAPGAERRSGTSTCTTVRSLTALAAFPPVLLSGRESRRTHRALGRWWADRAQGGGGGVRFFPRIPPWHAYLAICFSSLLASSRRDANRTRRAQSGAR
eukprot:gene171-biopygen4563